MRMRVHGLAIDVDLIREVVDLGELVKLGHVVGYSANMEAGREEWGEDDAHDVIRLYRRGRTWGETELAALAAVYGMVYERSGNQVLEQLRHNLERMGFPMERPISDVMEIGRPPEPTGDDEGGRSL